MTVRPELRGELTPCEGAGDDRTGGLSVSRGLSPLSSEDNTRPDLLSRTGETGRGLTSVPGNQ